MKKIFKNKIEKRKMKFSEWLIIILAIIMIISLILKILNPALPAWIVGDGLTGYLPLKDAPYWVSLTIVIRNFCLLVSGVVLGSCYLLTIGLFTELLQWIFYGTYKVLSIIFNIKYNKKSLFDWKYFEILLFIILFICSIFSLIILVFCIKENQNQRWIIDVFGAIVIIMACIVSLDESE